MTKTISQYSKKTELQQAKFLSRLAHQITIFARDTYEINSNSIQDPIRLRGINEIMHQILGQQTKLLSGDRRRYSDDILIKMIFDMAIECNFENDLESGIADSFEYCK